MELTPKTANQLYNESGSKLSFKDWIENEKGKIFMKNDTLANLVKEAKENTNVISKPNVQNDKIFGLSKNVILISATILILSIGYKLYTKNKS